ncbi:MAG: UbiA family prenyltransferase [Spirochaetales bacterium]|nr:UbiA family prenyltransferase [Spirochaetales bacterium]
MVTGLADFLRMIKFSHTIFALPFAGIAILVVWPEITVGPQLYLDLFKIFICMVTLRTAAMTFNRLADQKYDAQNPRTAMREIPSGKITPRMAVFITLFMLIIFVLTAFALSNLCGMLSPLAITITLGYSYAKRFTFLCHFWLGLAIGQAPAAAAIALTQAVPLSILFWSAGLMFYIAGFDILYSLMDQEFDRRARLHSIPARFGARAALYLARFSHLLSLTFFLLAAQGSGLLFYVVLGIVGILFFTEHYLVRGNNLDRIPLAFFHINAIISTVLFTGLLLDFYFRYPT